MSPTTAEEKLEALQQGESNEGTVDAIATTGHVASLTVTGALIAKGAVGAYATGGMASVGCFAAPLAVGMAGAMAGAYIANAIGADEWLADKIGGPRQAKPGPNPGHLTHPIAHSHKFGGLLAGLLVGALVAAAVAATLATGGLAGPLVIAAAAGLSGGFVGAMIAGAGSKLANITGKIETGSPNVRFEGQPAARVTDTCSCSKCSPMVPQIAEGSETIFINGLPMARVGHKLTCGAVVQEGCKTVSADNTTAQYGPVNADVTVLEQTILSVTEVGLALSAVKFRGSKTGKKVFGEPIEPISGDYYDRRVDLDFPGVLPLQLVRTYVGKDRTEGLLGPKWICNWSQRLRYGQEKGENTALLEDADGEQLLFALGFGEAFKARHLKAPHYLLSGTQREARLFDSRTQRTHVFAPEAEGSSLARLAAIEDRNGNRIDFHYVQRHLQRITHSDGAEFRVETTAEGLLRTVTLEGESHPHARYAYNEKGELTDVRSRSHGEFHFQYTREGWLSHWHDSGATSVDLDYDREGRVVATRTPEGLYNDRFEYHPSERRSVYIDALGARTTLWYDERELLLKEEDPLGRVTEFQWDGFERKVSAKDPLGRVTRYEYEPFGRLVSETDWVDRTIRYAYDKGGLLTAIEYPDGTKTAWAYDDRGNAVEVAQPDGTVRAFHYDPMGRLFSVTEPDGSARSWNYDSQGRLAGGRDALGRHTVFGEDAWGRLTRVIDPGGRSTRYDYQTGADNPRGDLGAIHYPDGGEERFAYDAEGQLSVHTGAEGQATRFRYGAFDLLQAITDPAGHTTKLAYDGAARLSRITNAAGRQWLYAYDAAGQLEAETDWAGRRTAYRRDALGRVVRKVLPDGAVQVLAWDDRDRITSVTTKTGRIAYEYDDQDRLVRATTHVAPGAPETDLQFVYDAAGNLAEELQNGVPIRYAYDAAGRCIQRTSPSGETSFTYDPCGELVSFASNGHALAIERDALGQEVARVSGPSAFTLRQSYDPCGRLAFQSAGKSRRIDDLPESHRRIPVLEAQGEIRRQYEWDRSGRLVGVQDSLRGRTDYRYDPRDQVRQVLRSATQSNERYDYNALMDLANSNGRRHAYQDGEVQNVGDTAYRYDARGRVVFKTVVKDGFRAQSWTYRWDDFDHLVEVETSAGETWRYTYDAFGRRVKKACVTPGKERTVRYLWQGANLVEETREEFAVTYRWHFEPGTFKPLAKEVVAAGMEERFYPIVTDHLGTPKELFSEEGECLWKADHSLWGKADTLVLRLRATINWPAQTTQPGKPLDCNLRFQNQWEDDETGLYYNLNRYYDPESGQYFSQDPIKLEGGFRTQGYVHDPLHWVDPLGLAGYVKFKRWKVGDAVDKPMPNGSNPSWDTVRARYWKNRAAASKTTGEFDEYTLGQMKQGRAPQDYNPKTGQYEPREIHHFDPQRNNNINVNNPRNFREVTPQQHANMDPYRRLKQ